MVKGFMTSNDYNLESILAGKGIRLERKRRFRLSFLSTLFWAHVPLDSLLMREI